MQGNLEISGGTGTGDITGASDSSVDNEIVRWDGTQAASIQGSGITIADGASGTLAGTNSGDVTLAGTPDYITLTNQVITRGEIQNDDIRDGGALTVIGRSANSSGDIADIAAVAASAAVLRESGSTIGFGTVATAGIADDAVTFAKLQDIATDRLIGRDTALTGNPEELTVGGGIEFTGSGGVQRSALTGDVTAAAGSGTTAIADNAVTDTDLRDSGALSVIGRSANSSGDPADIAASATSGAVLRESGSTLGFGTVATVGIADDAVTFAKLQEIATDRLLGRDTALTGNPEELTVGGGIEFTGLGGIQRSALTGDVTAAAGSGTTAIADNAVTNTDIRDSGALSVIGRSANSSGDPADITTTAASAAVLRESGSTLGFGTIATAGIADDAVTYAKIQDVAVSDRILGRDTAGAGIIEELTTSAVLDMVGTTRGSIAYRGASGWDILAPNTDGYVLTDAGVGADPAWEVAAGGGFQTQASSATGTQNNFDLSFRRTILRCSGASALIITGFQVGTATPLDGDQVIVINAGTSTVRVAYADTGSTDVHRILSPSTRGQIVGVGGVITLAYNTTDNRWRVVGVDVGTPIPIAFSAGNFTGGGSMTWTVDSGDVLSETYTQFGTILKIILNVSASTLGGTVSSAVYFALPNGFTIPSSLLEVYIYGRLFDNGAWVAALGIIYGAASTTAAQFGLIAGTNLTLVTNGFALQGNMSFTID